MKLPFNFRLPRLKKDREPETGVAPETPGDPAPAAAGKPGGGLFSFGRKRVDFGSGVVQVGVELENGRRLFYMIGENGDGNGIRLVGDEAVPGVPVVSAFSDDYRVFAQSPMNGSKAASFAARESDMLERIVVINESKRGRIYATPHSSLGQGELRVPMLAVLDVLAEDRKGSFVAGVMMGGGELVVLYAFNEGVVGKRQLQVAINPGNLDSAVYSFVSVSGLAEDTEVVIFEQADFIKVLAGRSWVPYPPSQRLFGVRAQDFPALIVGSSALIAVGAGSYAGYWHWQERHFGDLVAQHKQAKRDAEARIASELPSRRTAFSRATSVDVRLAAQTAEALRSGGSVVEATIGRDSNRYTVIADLFKPGDDVDGQAVGEVVGQVVSVRPPEGCSRQAMETNGGFSEIRVQYVCASPGAGASRFGW